MPRVFEYRRMINGTIPALERVTITGESVLHEIINLQHNIVFSTWTDTISGMGHKNEKALVDTLKLNHYQEVTA